MKTLLPLLALLLLPLPAFSAEKMTGPVRAEVIGAIDGDTLRVEVQVWLNQRVQTLVRIDGIDTPERHGKCDAEKEKAEEARAKLAEIAAEEIVLYDVRHDKYAGRVLAKAFTPAGADIARQLQGAGVARAYAGGKRGGWCS